MTISDAEIQVISRVFFAVIFGILIGLQRERRKLIDKSYGFAGLRTHSLVCVGASLISAAGSALYPASAPFLAASIMTGIGFIGAGSIISQQNKIKGLANAASIWISAAVGIATGLGLILSAAVTTVVAIVVLELRRFESID